MQQFEPLFLSSDELDRCRLRAKLIRNETLTAGTVGLLRRRAKPGRIFKVSAVLVAMAGAAFWAALVGAPQETVAGNQAPGIDPEQMTLVLNRELPSFSDKYQAHIGVLDKLEP